jgi:enolase
MYSHQYVDEDGFAPDITNAEEAPDFLVTGVNLTARCIGKKIKADIASPSSECFEDWK